MFCVLALRQLFNTSGSNLNTAQSPPRLSSQCSRKEGGDKGNWEAKDTKPHLWLERALTHKAKPFSVAEMGTQQYPASLWSTGSSTLPAQQGDPQAHRKVNIALGKSELCKKKHSGHTIFSTRNTSMLVHRHLVPTDMETKDFVRVFSQSLWHSKH